MSKNRTISELRVGSYMVEVDQGLCDVINTMMTNVKGSVTAVKLCFTRETMNFSTESCAVIRSCKHFVD